MNELVPTDATVPTAAGAAAPVPPGAPLAPLPPGPLEGSPISTEVAWTVEPEVDPTTATWAPTVTSAREAPEDFAR